MQRDSMDYSSPLKNMSGQTNILEDQSTILEDQPSASQDQSGANACFAEGELETVTQGLCEVETDTQGLCEVETDTQGPCEVETDTQGPCEVETNAQGPCEVETETVELDTSKTKQNDVRVDTCQDLLRDQLSILRRVRPLAEKHYEQETPRLRQTFESAKVVAHKIYKRATPYVFQVVSFLKKKLVAFVDWVKR